MLNLVSAAGILACLDGYMNIAMEQTEVSTAAFMTALQSSCLTHAEQGSFARQLHTAGTCILQEGT
jgi:hypothetical protein